MSETKDFTTLSTASGMSFLFTLASLALSSQGGNTEKPGRRGAVHTVGLCHN